MRARAVVMRRTGPPEVLSIEDVDLLPLRSGEVRIRCLASAVNHSDLEIRAGNWAIAGASFPALITSLRHGGRYCIVGAMGGGNVQFDAWGLLYALTLTGYSTEDLDGPAAPKGN